MLHYITPDNVLKVQAIWSHLSVMAPDKRRQPTALCSEQRRSTAELRSDRVRLLYTSVCVTVASTYKTQQDFSQCVRESVHFQQCECCFFLPPYKRHTGSTSLLFHALTRSPQPVQW